MCERCGLAAHSWVPAEKAPSRRLVLAAAAAAGAIGTIRPASVLAEGAGTPAVGFAAPAASLPLERFAFLRRELRDDDVLIDIAFCGVCHSDIHTIRGEWGPQPYPLVPGHEIVGRVTAVGRSVTRFKVGDPAGVGCMVDSCGTCEHCRAGLEQYCQKGTTFTYGQTPSGGVAQGGYSNRIVVRESFVIKIPEKMFAPSTAPLLCAGVTTFSPMRHWKVAPTSSAAVIGLGGLGHMAVKLLAANGTPTTVFTTSPAKVAAATALGAKNAVVWQPGRPILPPPGEYDYIISTVPTMFDFNPFLSLLKLDGAMVNVGAFGPIMPSPDGTTIIIGRRSLTGSVIGGIAETQEVIDLCAAKNIAADVEVIPMSKVNEAIDRVVAKDIRFRFVIDMSTLA
jgi:alcohol dehydrogenase (NADP+)